MKTEEEHEDAQRVREALMVSAPEMLVAAVAAKIKDAHLAAISRAPQDQWPRLVRATATRGWTPPEVAAAVQNLEDPDIADWRKAELLAGVSDPVVCVAPGQYGILPITFHRREKEALRHDGVLALLEAVEKVLKLTRFTPTGIATDLHERDRARLRTGPGSLEECIRLLADIRGAIE